MVSMFTLGCDRSNTPSPVLNLAGTWTGTLFHPGGGTSGTPMQVTWVATQNGMSVSGSHTLVHPTVGTMTGTLTGTLTGNELALTQTVPAGNIPGFPSCSFTATASVPATASSITGSLNTTFRTCDSFNMFTNGSVPAVLALTK